MNALANTLGELQIEAVRDTVTYVNVKKLVHDTVTQETALTQQTTLGDMNANTLVNALTDTLKEEKSEIKKENLRDMKAETLVEAMANTLTKHQGQDSKQILHYVKGKITSRGSGCHGSREEAQGQDIYRINV